MRKSNGKEYRLRTAYGNEDIPIYDFRDLTHTRDMRRLTRVSTLGCVNEVYPGATHNRFEHVLGTFYLALRAAESLGLPEYETKLVAAYAMTHDIGHGPESHIWEFAAKSITGKDHKSVGIERMKSQSIRNALRVAGVNPDDVIAMHERTHPLSAIVSNIIGVDKLDYTWRDRHECGLNGGCDVTTIITNYNYDPDNGLAISDKAAPEARAFLRTFLDNYFTVYLRKSVEIVKGLKLRAIYDAISSGNLDPKVGWGMDDAELMVALRNGPESTRRYVEMLDTRTFPKTAGTLKLQGFADAERPAGKPIHVEEVSRDERAHMSELYANQFDTNMGNIRRLERNVAKKLGLQPDDVLITFPRNFGDGVAKKIKIHREGSASISELDLFRKPESSPSVVGISEIYPTLDTEVETEASRHWATRICVPEEKRQEAYEAMRKIGLRELILD
ncbi:MAG: HD domain-containing protein [Candidatus Aenigmatarchaeota archaeon]